MFEVPLDVHTTCQDLSHFSGRKMANLLVLFSILDDIDISYKTIERAYSNPLVKLIIHNMFIIWCREKGSRKQT